MLSSEGCPFDRDTRKDLSEKVIFESRSEQTGKSEPDVDS